MGSAASSILALIVIGLYFLPAIVAEQRHKKNRTAIFLLNLLLGWTVIGWILALVWATTVDSDSGHVQPAQVPWVAPGAQMYHPAKEDAGDVRI